MNASKAKPKLNTGTFDNMWNSMPPRSRQPLAHDTETMFTEIAVECMRSLCEKHGLTPERAKELRANYVAGSKWRANAIEIDSLGGSHGRT